MDEGGASRDAAGGPALDYASMVQAEARASIPPSSDTLPALGQPLRKSRTSPPPLTFPGASSGAGAGSSSGPRLPKQRSSSFSAGHGMRYEPAPSESESERLDRAARRRVPRRHDPGKIYNPDGTFRLRGVSSTSDVKRYTSGVNPHSRQHWELREAYKLMRHEQHSSAAMQTWGALHSWCASEKSFDQWYANASRGVKFTQRQ
eukprot:TRINITY_DN14834_c0_g1_i1.p1 TRINITY_DN14834_c0_g1~~TRINITY_DN14834_c0_g1_i1.p1  ORF type:complete len:204 (-),score=21.58 TRINITY_DN14834_c0_g1_i1:72-683(-)